jgi:C-terminal peptidase prc
MSRTSIAGLFAALIVSPLFAAEEAPKQSTTPHIVLIGISDYADKQIKSRPNAENDVKALYDLFTNKSYLGADPQNVRMLLGNSDGKTSQPATRENILKELSWLADFSKRDDLAILVFIGEGGPLGDKSDRRCYFASDTVFKDRNKTAIASSEVEERLKKLKSAHFCAFVDIDFKGYKDKTVLDVALGASPYRELLGDDATDEHNFIPGRTLVLATNGLSASIDLKEHGLLTHVLLAGLKGEADKDGYEPDGIVTVGELTTYLSKQMSALAKEHGKTKEEKSQASFVLGDRTSSTPLTTNPAVIGKVRERLKKIDQLVADKKLSDALAEEARKLLSQMPHLKAQQDIRKLYQQLADGDITTKALEEKRESIVASTKLDRDLALKFADKVLDGTEIVLEEFIRKMDQADLVGFAIRGLYKKADQKPSTAISDKLDKIKKMDKDELKKLLVDARLELGKREDLDGGKDVDVALQRMMASVKDTYSTYIDPATKEQFDRLTSGKFVGIGVSIRKDPRTDYLMVITPLKGSPAYKAGIRAGDLITTVTLEVDREGKPLDKPEVVSMKGLNVNDAVKKISGMPKTNVKVTIERPGEDKPREFDISRAQIEMETVMGHHRKKDDDWSFFVDEKEKIGYIRLTQFTRKSAIEMAAAMKELEKAGVRGLVLDLRFNPGGLLTTAREITDLFIDDGLIVSIRPREGKEEKLGGFSEGSKLKFPMACMVNGGSASGSEILSAALQDHHRAIIIGERSFGKGSVQNVVPFGKGEIKLTTASFWRPSGKNLNKASTKGRDEDEWGVLPDPGFEVKLTPKETDDLEEAQKESETIYPQGGAVKKTTSEFKDKQLDKALDYVRGQIKLADKARKAKPKDDE